MLWGDPGPEVEMRRLLLIGCLAVLSGGCSEREVVVTREQFGEAWPLAVNSARIECSEDGSVAVLRLGSSRYALNEAARARGHADALEVAREVPVDSTRPELGSFPADMSPLRGVCEAQVAAAP